MVTDPNKSNGLTVYVFEEDLLKIHQFLMALFGLFGHALETYLWARREATSEEADDAVAELFLSLYQNVLAGSLGSPRTSWWRFLVGGASRKFHRRRRRALQSTPVANEIELEKIISREPVPLDWAVYHEMLEAIQGVTFLTRQEKRVTDLLIEGLPYAQIAKQLKLSIGSAWFHASRARREFRKHFWHWRAA